MAREKMPGWSYTDDTDMKVDDALMSPGSLEVVRQGKDLYQKGFAAGDQAMMDQGHAMAEGERAKYGYSGGANGGGYVGLTPTVEEPDYGEAPSEYKTAMDRAIQTLQGRGKFTYDPEKDPSYQQYKDQYTRLGKRAMEDSYGHAAFRTGGLGGSAAMSASQQAYNGYMQALADKVPELRQIAYQMWRDEEDSIRRDIDLYGSLDQQAWNRWNSDRSFRRGAFESDRSFDYNKSVDQWNMVRNLDRDKKADAETEYQHGQDALNRQERADEREYERALGLAGLLAQGGDYSGYGAVYGQLTPEQIAAMDAIYADEKARADADWYAGYGDLSKVKALGVNPQLAASGGSGRDGGGGGPTGSGLLDMESIYQLALQQGGSDPLGWIGMNYKALGIPYSEIKAAKEGYQNWLKGVFTPAAEQYAQPYLQAMKDGLQGVQGVLTGKKAATMISNQAKEDSIHVPTIGWVDFADLENLVNSGYVLESYDEKTGRYSYTANPKKK